MNKAQNTLRDLQAAIENESLAGESTHYTRRSAAVATLANALYQSNLSNGPTQQPQQLPYYYYNNRSNSHSQRNQGLYGRRADGVYVRLSCPVCKRDDFANRQGFLNHCRLSHKLEFGPYEQTMIQCGTPVDESQVPMDDPCRSRPITMPIPPIK
ncbi:hypothetical protein INT45_007558 [Circinella minor]|uniref:AHC1-like C2H2 zinc-finger domain-containing protein n=1 Tax=Circinella minor TaxID=1195481 RepID=A0A8H7S3A8_9FUNG|nr:hypothetical protein INT45_007558 [Circinella minor]